MSHQECGDQTMATEDGVVLSPSSDKDRQSEERPETIIDGQDDGRCCDIDQPHQAQQQQHVTIQRSESVIKSPSKSTPTPVIQVIDTASGQIDGEQKKCSSICSPSNGANFLLSSNIAPNNPFLRATSFHTNSSLSSSSTSATSNCADGDASDSSSGESQIIFAPPKLIPSSLGPPNATSSFLQPTILKTSDGSISGLSVLLCFAWLIFVIFDDLDIRKPNETISASKTFISLNKEDIGKIKTPAFIQLTSPLITSNGGSNTTSLITTSSSDETTSVMKSSNTLDGAGTSKTFLFGQKVEDRVVIDQSELIANSSQTASSSTSSANHALSFPSSAATVSSSSSSCSSSDRPHLISFSDVSNCEESTIIKTLTTQSTGDNDPDSSTTFTSVIKNGGDSNAESIFKRKYEVITGEEGNYLFCLWITNMTSNNIIADEQNVLSIHGRLYAWDTDKASWVEKGRGPLHLNDVMKDEKLCSRLGKCCHFFISKRTINQLHSDANGWCLSINFERSYCGRHDIRVGQRELFTFHLCWWYLHDQGSL